MSPEHEWVETMKQLIAVVFLMAGLAGCMNYTGTDCGDGVVGSESHWANCGDNGATNNANGEADAGSGNFNNTSGNNTAANNGFPNNASPNNSTSPNNVSDAGMADAGSDAGADAGGDMGADMGTADPSCYAFRWNDTSRTFDSARCSPQDDSTFLCDCFDLGQTQSLALTCDDALAECGATFDERGGCAMTNEAGCTATDTGWECTCQGIDGVFMSDAPRCDTAYYESCYAEQFCTFEFDAGQVGRCVPELDENYTATGFLCGCYQDGVETAAPQVITANSCADAAPQACQR
jgi:hypothetical protein